MVIFLGGLQTIPGELYEAAAMDGAGSVRQFFAITLPLLYAHHLFQPGAERDQPLSRPSPAPLWPPTAARSIRPCSWCCISTARPSSSFNMGYAAALAWVLFAIILVLTLLLMRSQRFWVFYLGERSE